MEINKLCQVHVSATTPLINNLANFDLFRKRTALSIVHVDFWHVHDQQRAFEDEQIINLIALLDRVKELPECLVIRKETLADQFKIIHTERFVFHLLLEITVQRKIHRYLMSVVH